MLRNKRIILALTGGIALYKWCAVVRGLVKAGAVVRISRSPSRHRSSGLRPPGSFDRMGGGT